MNLRKTAGILLLVVGIGILILFAAADIFGIGEDPAAFGPWQISGTIAGAIVAVIGLVLLVRKSQNVVTGEPGA